ncbi:MAG TPA: hypothetical protein VM077_03210 [Candidatus Limnocylindrales bacterium]|nr:hypothetical protein [Candidatus Limnocylindrales bacterium]
MKKISSNILSFLPYLIVFLSSLFTPSDPDLGWHLKYGEYFFNHGRLLRDNTFSALMPDYKWANTSWGTDLITYSSFSLGGFFALTILGALVVMLTFYLFSKSAKLTTWDQIFLFPLLLYFLTPVNSIAFRGQQISLLLLGSLFCILSLYQKGSRVIYIVVPLFLVWANLHGQFILGLIMFAAWIIVYSFQKIFKDFDKKQVVFSIKEAVLGYKKEFGILILVFGLSIFSTFINPFGAGVHRDAISHIGSPLLKNIAEYLPFPTLSYGWWNQVAVAILIGMGLIYLFLKNKLLSQLPVIFSVTLLFILSFSVRRFAWPAYYLVLPMLKPLPGFFKPDSRKITIIFSYIFLLIILTIITIGKIPLSKYYSYNWEDYCKNEFMKCSSKAFKFINEKKLTENLYSLYSWGGYFIWNYPDIKPTIDGRMHMWRDKKGYSAFEDYYAIEQNIKDIDKSQYNVALMSTDKPVYKRLIELVNSNEWKLAYKDQYTVVFVRNK